MGILDALAARLGYAKAQPLRPPSEMLSVADGFRWDMPEAQEAEKQMRLYAALTWISTAIDTVAGMAAQGVLSVTRIKGEPDGPDDEAIPNHPFEKLLNRPNPMQSRGEFLRDCAVMYKTTGNLYIFSNAPSETMPPDELWIVPSHMIRPIPDGRSYVAGYEFTPPTGRKEFIPRWQIAHMKTANPLNPFVGLSALQSLALDSFGDLAQQKWNVGLFDKNAGKFPGILAFKHMIADPEWNKMIATRDKEWGGTTRAQLMMLRGVGDTVQWLPSALSQKEMEFIESRNFTKEEIYGKLAPGLSSILAVNATEANAIAGKATLIEFGVWPFMVQLQEKFNAEYLPLYGDNLRCEFDDMRQTNRILDLQEQAEFAKYHTINEIRVEYYDEGALELDPDVISAMDEKPRSKLDPRGFLFPAQIGPSTPGPGLGAPRPAAPPPSANGAEQPPPQIQQEDDALPSDTEKMDEQQAEMKAWERFALKRLGKTNVREFEPRVLDVFAAGRIRAALKTARTPEDVRRVFARETNDTLTELLAEVRAARAELERAK